MAVSTAAAPTRTDSATLKVVEEQQCGKQRLAVVEDGNGLQHLARQQLKKVLIEGADGKRTRKGSNQSELVWVKTSDLAVWHEAVQKGLVVFP